MSDYGVLLQQVVNGLSLGAMYALLALGFTLVYGILELINFAHFNVFMVSSFVGMWALELLGISGQGQVLTGLALAGALVFAFTLTMLAAGVLGVAIERLSLRPLRRCTDERTPESFPRQTRSRLLTQTPGFFSCGCTYP